MNQVKIENAYKKRLLKTQSVYRTIIYHKVNQFISIAMD